jgi:hypothetical protein
MTVTYEKDIQDVTNQHIPLREEVERELRLRAWKDEAFRQELIANPKGVIERLFPHYFPDGKVPDKVTYKVIVEDPYTHHILLPALPEELTDQISEEKLKELLAIMEVSGASTPTVASCTCTCVSRSCTCTCSCSVCGCGSRFFANLKIR